MKKIGSKKTLQALIESTITSDVKQEDEFTTQDFYEQALASGKDITMCSARNHLTRLIETGKIKSRKGRVNGRSANFYSIVE